MSMMLTARPEAARLRPAASGLGLRLLDALRRAFPRRPRTIDPDHLPPHLRRDLGLTDHGGREF